MGPTSRPFQMMRFLHTYAERHADLTQSVLTRAATFRTKRLIVFLTPGFEMRTGGVMAIASFYRESIALRHIHGAKVVLCTLPGDSPFLKYSWFENHNYILDLESVLKGCTQLEYLSIHIPAYTVDRILDWLTATSSTLLSNIREIHLNILLMNIDSIQGKNVSGLKRFGKVTCTTAHEAYTNSTTREAMGVPLHRLSVCIGPDNYSLSGYREKEPLLIVSPDPHPLKEKVLHRIAQACPDLTIKIIENLSYRDYTKLACRAKWSLTFGEGLDGYFIEPVLSGGVSFAVFNDRFFTPPFSNLETLYQSWEVLMENITADIKRLDEPVAYDRCWRRAYDLACSLYSTEQFRENLCMFYRGEYTFP
jgi:hypothetical protein